MKISVTMLSTYLFCERKLYLQKVLGLKEPIKGVMVDGKIRHEIFEKINELDKEIVLGIDKKLNLEDIQVKFRKTYYEEFFNVLGKHKEEMFEFNIDPVKVFSETWPIFLYFAEKRAIEVFNLMDKENVYSEELWSKLYPKYLTELWVESDELKLKGIIDRVELFEDYAKIVELKTGKAPSNGLWPGHRVQLGAYLMLLSEKYKSEEGIVDYFNYNKKFNLSIDEDLRKEILKLRDNVFGLIESKKLPEKCGNINKCNVCGLKEQCFKLN